VNDPQQRVVTDKGRATTPRRGPFKSLLAAEGISQIGNMMAIVAGPWFVL
jgi:hypothetical protein